MNPKPFALIVLTFFAALLLSACAGAVVEGQPVSAAPAAAAVNPSATPTPVAPTPTPQATPTATAPRPTTPPNRPDIQYLPLPAVNCCRGRTLEPGRYAAPSWLGLPLAFEVGEGWRVLNEERARLFLLGRGQNAQNNPSQIIVLIDATDAAASPESIIAAVEDIPQLSPITGPVSVAIAGFPGWQLDSVAKSNPEEKGDPSADIPPGIQYLPFFEKYFAPGFLWTTSTPEARVRTAALRVGERTLILYMEAPAAEFDPFMADADALLWTLRSLE